MQKPQGGLGRGLGALLPVSDVGRRTSDVVTSDSGMSVVSQDARRTTHDTLEFDRLLQISPSSIVANPRQPRHHFAEEDLADLKASILEHGIMQPLVVTQRADGVYELIAGERRLRSAKAVGLKTVPVIVRVANDQQKLELALIENIQRADFNAV